MQSTPEIQSINSCMLLKVMILYLNIFACNIRKKKFINKLKKCDWKTSQNMIIYSYSEPLNNIEQTHTKNVLGQNEDATV